jgi:hypothetical protein
VAVFLGAPGCRPGNWLSEWQEACRNCHGVVVAIAAIVGVTIVSAVTVAVAVSSRLRSWLQSADQNNLVDQEFRFLRFALHQDCQLLSRGLQVPMIVNTTAALFFDGF